MKNGLKLMLVFTIITTMSYSSGENLDNVPDGPGDLYRTAQIDISAKKYSNAIEKMKKVVEIAPKDEGVRLEIARVYKSAGEIENSCKEYEYSIKIEQDNEVIFEYGNLCFQNKKYNKAFEVFKKDKSENYKNEFGAAVAARLAGNFDEAEVYYKKVITKNPDLADAYFGLGVVYQKQKSYDAAIENFRKYLKRKKNEDVYSILSSLYMLKEDYIKAKETINKGLKEYPDSEKLKKLSKIALAKKN